MSKEISKLEELIRDTELPKINYKEHNSISFSQYSLWLNCPHSWYLKYVKDEDPFKYNIHMMFGSSIHDTIQNYIDIMYNESGVAADEIDLENFFDERFVGSYKKFYEKHKYHFSTADELREFYQDGAAIVNYFKNERLKFFSRKNYKLLGIELPLIQEIKKNLFFKGYLDVVLYNTLTEEIEIFDFKTSTRGWFDKDKKDEGKTSQLLLYKDFFSKQYGVDPKKIKVEFLILKRKLWENAKFPVPRIQRFSPPNGKNKINQTKTKFEEFINECFDNEGERIDKVYTKNVSEYNCKYCPFNDKPDLCDKINKE